MALPRAVGGRPDEGTRPARIPPGPRHSHPLRLNPRWMPKQIATVTSIIAG
ncbi:hypothetical protein SAMN05428945_0543 [Streptomyces sp. 2224.1]|nr:hypothetical protein SAMN05428945_0543 [Streptomyces sp. 2224.1]